jgi:hypothetical protein
MSPTRNGGENNKTRPENMLLNDRWADLPGTNETGLRRRRRRLACVPAVGS